MHYIPLPLQFYVPLMLVVLGMFFLAVAVAVLAHHGQFPFMRQMALERQTRQARMNRMLSMRGIPRAYYVRVAGVKQVRLDLIWCHACPSKTRCDLARIAGPGRDPEYSFCPNAASLSRVQRRMRAR